MPDLAERNDKPESVADIEFEFRGLMRKVMTLEARRAELTDQTSEINKQLAGAEAEARIARRRYLHAIAQEELKVAGPKLTPERRREILSSFKLD